MNKLAALKTRANKLGLMLRQDRLSRRVAVNVRGRAGNLYEGTDLSRVKSFLDRFEKKIEAEELARAAALDDYLWQEFGI